MTVDVDTVTDGQVTLRNRDTMTQERLPMEKVGDVVGKALKDAASA